MFYNLHLLTFTHQLKKLLIIHEFYINFFSVECFLCLPRSKLSYYWRCSYFYNTDSLTAALDALGYPWTLIESAALTSSDFDEIDVFIDSAITLGANCGDYYTLSILAIQFLDNGGASFFMLENGRYFYNCNQQKIENVINPIYYISNCIHYCYYI